MNREEVKSLDGEQADEELETIGTGEAEFTEADAEKARELIKELSDGLDEPERVRREREADELWESL